jgi:hypothetical protein
MTYEGVALVLVATLFYAGMDLVSYYILRGFDAISFIVYVCLNCPPKSVVGEKTVH